MSGMTITPIGKLIQKIHCQARPSAMAPPTTGPAMSASPVTPLNIPSALARSSRGNAALKSAIASGMTSAAPAPWTARAAISAPMLPASAHAAEATTNKREASGEHAPAPEAVAERRAGQQQHGEAQVIGIDRPLQRLDRGAEIKPDRAQRGRDDQRVERDHERRHRGQRKHPGFVRCFARFPHNRSFVRAHCRAGGHCDPRCSPIHDAETNGDAQRIREKNLIRPNPSARSPNV